MVIHKRATSETTASGGERASPAYTAHTCATRIVRGERSSLHSAVVQVYAGGLRPPQMEMELEVQQKLEYGLSRMGEDADARR